ncbi:MAG: YebC/PmpR family DNA-binding transcriptional regulator, partial [Planctomycetes bacterium]|nr:YebC/PmpR family DNA-binding transcriptional regulator [Planctomycetota bacterium]
YEGYGPGGAAVLVDSLTDNRARTASEMRLMFETHGGNLGASGCVAWNFEPRGVILVEGPGVDEEKVMAAALEAGADDIEPSGEGFQVLTDPREMEAVRAALGRAGLPVASWELSNIPKSTVEVDLAAGRRLLSLLEELNDHDDVQNVACNFEAPDELFQEASRCDGSRSC